MEASIAKVRLMGRDWRRDDLLFGGLVLAFIGTTLTPYIALSMQGNWIADDARQQTWPIWTLIDPARVPPDYFSRFMIATMPPGFVWIMEHLSGIVGTPEPVFASVGVFTLLVCAVLAWLTGRSTGIAIVAWASLFLLFSIDEFAGRTAGGLPRAVGLAASFLGVYGFVAARPLATAGATLLGALLWYPAAVISGPLFALQLVLPKSWLGFAHTLGISTRVGLVALLGLATLASVAPDVLESAPYGKMITAHDPDWPEAGIGGRHRIKSSRFRPPGA